MNAVEEGHLVLGSKIRDGRVRNLGFAAFFEASVETSHEAVLQGFQNVLAIRNGGNRAHFIFGLKIAKN
jgi:hypothetical protein